MRIKLKPREIRMLIYLAVFLAVLAWKPSLTIDGAHHTIYSSATRWQTEEVARVLEALYAAYSNRFGALPDFQREHPKLKVKLFQDRKEFRRINRGLGWAEAFYRAPYCRAYYSAEENNSYHWMVHEAVHQLDHEVAHLKLEKWLEEGLADYFATSRIQSNRLAVGRIDLDTYPVWWIEQLATTGDLQENLRRQSVIPLRAVITNRGGPSLNSHVNLYYLHWWTLTHFVFENPKYRERATALVRDGGGLAAFEKLIGPVEQAQSEWHGYVRELKSNLARGGER